MITYVHELSNNYITFVQKHKHGFISNKLQTNIKAQNS